METDGISTAGVEQVLASPVVRHSLLTGVAGLLRSPRGTGAHIECQHDKLICSDTKFRTRVPSCLLALEV
jgi:hypothetical protein